MTEFKTRVLLFLEEKKIGQTKFEEKTGLSRGTVNNIKDGISTTSLTKIINLYPDLNIVWLLTGMGPMLLTGDQCSPLAGVGGGQSSNLQLSELIAAKDQIIQAQQQTIQAQAHTIAALQQTINTLIKKGDTNSHTQTIPA